jgi:hypothetical protein
MKRPLVLSLVATTAVTLAAGYGRELTHSGHVHSYAQTVWIENL